MPFEGYKRRDENSGYLQAGVVPKTTENVDGTLTQHVNVDESALPNGASTSALQAIAIANQTNGTQKTKLVDAFGFQGEFTPMRDFKITEPYRVVGTVFGASTDSNFWSPIITGTSSAAGVSGGFATISSGVSNNGYGQYMSVRPARFLFAHPLMFRGAFRVTNTTVALNTRRWGAFSVSGVVPQNGVYFEVSPAGVLSVNTVSNGVVTSVSSGSFNGDVASYTMDTNVHAYEIVYFTMGAWFYIDNVLIHRVTPTTGVLYQTLNVGICMTSANGAAGVTSGTLECWNAVILRLGRDLTEPKSIYQTGTTAGLVCKIGAGTLHQLIVSNVSNNSAITLYDNTSASGAILWSSGAMGAQTQPFNVDLHQVAFYTGLTLVIAAAACNVTMVYE